MDLHPPLYTAGMWLSSRIAGGPSLLTLGQSLFLAAAIAAVVRALSLYGVDRRHIVMAAVPLVISPMVGSFSISLWKDIPYGASFLFAGARIIDLTGGIRDDDEPAARRSLWSLIRWLGFACAFRQNGILVAGLLLTALFMTLRTRRRQVAAGVAICLAVVGLLRAAVYPVMGVEAQSAQAPLAMFLHDIAAVAWEEPSALEPRHRRLMASVAPVDAWQSGFGAFGCSSANWEHGLAFKWTALEGRSDAYYGVWFDLLRSDPAVVVGNRLCAGAVAWRPDSVGQLYTVSRGIEGNPFGLRTVPIWKSWRDAGAALLDATDKTWAQAALWRAPLWCYIAYALLITAARRHRRWIYLLPALLPLSLQLAVLAVNPAQDARYMFPGLIFAVLLLPFAVRSLEPERQAAEASPTPSDLSQALSGS